MQKNLRNWKYAGNEIIRIKNGPTREEALRNSAAESSVNFRSARYGGAITVFTYVCGTMEVHKQGTPEVLLRPGGALLCTWHSGRLICTSGVPCCSLISTLFLLFLNKL